MQQFDKGQGDCAANRQEQQKEYFVDSLLKAVQAARRTARVKNMELTGISAHQSDEVMAMLNQCKVNS